MLGRVLSGYRLDERLGEGSMGAVFRATQLQLGRSVALKVLPPALSERRRYIERFLQEARTLARINHPYIVHIYDLFEADGLFCIAMGLVEGGTVRDLIQREGGRVAEDRAARVAYQTARGLWAAAQHGVVHQDIKPDNLLLADDGTVKIADFGLAQVKTPGSEEGGKIQGSPSYMSPEQWKGRSDQRSDLYALGCNLYEMLTGHPPFRALTTEGFRDLHCGKPAPSLLDTQPDCSPAMAGVVARLLEKDPELRFQTAAELGHALKPLCKAPEHAEAAPSPQPQRRTSTRVRKLRSQRVGPQRTPMWPFVLLAVLLALGGWWVVRGPSTPDPTTISVRFEALEPQPGALLRNRQVRLRGKLVELDAGEERVLDKLQIDGKTVDVRRNGSFEHLVELQEGDNRCELRAGKTRLQLQWFVDSVAPQLAFLEPAGGSLVDTLGVDVRLLVQERDLEAVEVNGLPVQRIADDTLGVSVPLRHGNNRLQAVARDRAGNESRVALEVQADTASPQLQVDVALVATGARLSIRADEPLSWIEVGGRRTPANGPQAELEVELRPEQDSLELQAADRVGNQTRIVLPLDRPEPENPGPEPWWPVTLEQQAASIRAEQPVTLRNSLGMDFVLVPAGTYWRGSPPEEPGHREDELEHKVHLPAPYYLGAREVTQAQWVAVMGANPSWFQLEGGAAPVESVTWLQAVHYCNALSALEGLPPAYAIDAEQAQLLEPLGPGYRLPSEAEWEYACRAGSELAFSTGARLLSSQAHIDTEGGAPRAGGSYSANTWGLYDMHGNVYEWCGDWYGAYPEGEVEDPRGPAQGSRHVTRGGAFDSPAQLCRSAERKIFGHLERENLGFRIVRGLP